MSKFTFTIHFKCIIDIFGSKPITHTHTHKQTYLDINS